MIPSIRRRIDRENNPLEDEEGAGDGGGDRNGNHAVIPQAELDELRDFRRAERMRQARAKHDAQLLEMAEAEGRRSRGLQTEIDDQRPFGLPQGVNCVEDVWEKIFDHVHNADDIWSLRATCTLFKDLLEEKYKIKRMTEVVFKFAGRFGLNTLLALRSVCKSTKAAVDQWFSEDWIDDRCWNLECRENILRCDSEQFGITKPHWHLPPDMGQWEWDDDDGEDGDKDEEGNENEGQDGEKEKEDRRIRKVMNSPELRKVSWNSFPIKKICLKEFFFIFDYSAEHVLTLHKHLEQLLGLIGAGVGRFEYRTVDDLEGYNRLKTWMALMPNLVELIIWVKEKHDRQDFENRPALPQPLPPFPACPKLRRFINRGSGLRAPLVEQIILANPWISGVSVNLNYPDDIRELEADEVETYRRALGSLRLERFNSEGVAQIPRSQLLEYRFGWPLRNLVLDANGDIGERFNPGIPSRNLFIFLNSFRQTLEEVVVTWKIRDTGGFLDLPKVRKVRWRLFPGFTSFQFMIPLESLEQLDVDLYSLMQAFESFEDFKTFIDNMKMSLPPLFPALKEIWTTMKEFPSPWLPMWKR